MLCRTALQYVCFQVSQWNDNIKSSRHITESFLISQMKALLMRFCIYHWFLFHTRHLSVKKNTKTKRWNLRRPEFGEKILLSIFLQLSFLNGWSYKFLVGLNWKISSCSFHASYSFCFFERKWLSYEGFCANTCLLYNFKSISIFLQLSFLNGWSYKFLVGLNWKISSCSFHTSYSFCFFEQKWLSYEGFCATTCLLYDVKAFLLP